MALYLVTGGSGFIGSHIAAVLCARGERVRILDNFSTGNRENLKASPGAEVVEGDIRSYHVVREAVEGCAGALVFRWLSQPDRPLYRLSVTDASGREVWSTETRDTTIALPAEVSLDRGRTYFWTVDALGADGRSLTSRTKRFSTTP